jgi:diguanylate cyclase (GGDEF)-like protein
MTTNGSTFPPGDTRTPDVVSRVLIVEDELLIALDLRVVLTRLGYVVVGMATSSAGALRHVHELHPDVVLMDIRLQGDDMDGIATAEQIDAELGVPIIFMTANTDPETMARALALGPEGYLAKPFDQRTLHAAIQVALRRHRAQRDLQGEKARLLREQRNLEHHARELEELAEHFRRESVIDPLTGLFNRRHLGEALAQALEFARRGALPISTIFVDIDHFKSLNDTFGHAAGDAVLRGVASFLRERLRGYDIICRYGGEEVVIVMPGASLANARDIAEQLRSGVEALRFVDGDRTLSAVTASFGVAAFPEHGSDVETLLRAADRALYLAKSGGRNRVCTTP